MVASTPQQGQGVAWLTSTTGGGWGPRHRGGEFCCSSSPALPSVFLAVRLLAQEEYSDFKTLEHRLQEVARRLVHRPGAQGPSSSQGTPGLLPNGVFDPGSSQQPQQAGQQFALAPGTANPTVMLSAYPGAQGSQAGPGMVPTPPSVAGDVTELLSVKPEPGSSANGTVPAAAAEGAADPTGSFQASLPGSSIGASPALGTSNAMGTALMSNGAPVLIKQQDVWSMPSPGMVPVRVRALECREGGWPASQVAQQPLQPLTCA